MSPYLPREIWILTNFELIQLSRYGVPIRALDLRLYRICKKNVFYSKYMIKADISH